LRWNLFWRDIQRDKITRSGGEVNRLIGRFFTETLPAVGCTFVICPDAIKTQNKISLQGLLDCCHGGRVKFRLRGFDGKELALPSWERAPMEDLLSKCATNQMLIKVSTRKFERSVRLPEDDDTNQLMPAPAYTRMFERMLTHLNCPIISIKPELWSLNT
jgi:hypothetical protein